MDALAQVDKLIEVMGIPALLRALAKAANIKADEELMGGNKSEAHRWKVREKALDHAAAATL